MRKVVLTFGIIITVFGWLLSNSDHYLFVYRIIAPQYFNSIYALNRMREKNFVLKKDDIGFSEISEILRQGGVTPIISQIRTLNWWSGASLFPTPEGPRLCSYSIKLEILFSNGQSITREFYNLKLSAEEMYLANKIFLWKKRIFWTGIGDPTPYTVQLVS